MFDPQSFEVKLEQYGYKLPRGCVFHEEKDMLRVYEEKKMQRGVNVHECGFCGEIFTTAKLLEMHFEASHESEAELQV